MFKRLELWWNARTPVWLHNGTKENFLFQFGAAVIIVGVIIAKDEWEERQRLKRLNAPSED